MDDRFEDFIRQSMDNPPTPAFEERMWKDMEGRLNRSTQRNRGAGWWASLPWILLTFLTTGAAGFFYVKHHNALERIAVVEQQLAAKALPAENLDPQKQSVVLYDTIYRTLIIDEYKQLRNPIAATPGSAHQQRTFANPIFNRIDHGERLFALANTGIQTYMQNSDWGITAKKASRKMGEDLAGRQETYVFDWGISAKELPTLLLDEEFRFDQSVRLPSMEVLRNQQKRDVRFYLNNLRPTHFSLSGTTGTFASLNLGGSGFNLRGSAHAELGLGHRLSVVAGVEYFSNDFTRRIEIEDVDPLEGFPDLPPNNEEDVLTEIQGDFNYLQIPFGLKYVVFPRKYIEPYVGLGLIYGKTTRSRLEYEYISPVGLYAVSEGRLLPNLFEFNAMYGSVGIQIQMNKRWSLLLEGSGQMDIKQGVYKYENLELLKLNTGVKYQF